MAPTVHRRTFNAHISVTPEEWHAFGRLCEAEGTQIRLRLADIVRSQLAGSGFAVTQAVAGQLELEPAPRRSSSSSARSRKGKTPATRNPAGSKAQKGLRDALRAAEAAPARRRGRKLPVVDEGELRRADAAGRRAAKAPAKAKANKRSPAPKKGRPTRRRSS